jgi:hypothetical protein
MARNFSSVLTQKDADKIREEYKQGINQIDLSAKYSVSRVTINKIINNKTYKDVNYTHPGKNTKEITLELATECRRLSKVWGQKHAEISKKLDISRKKVAAILRNEIHPIPDWGDDGFLEYEAFNIGYEIERMFILSDLDGIDDIEEYKAERLADLDKKYEGFWPKREPWAKNKT